MIGKRDIWRSTHCTDKAEAQSVALKIRDRLQARFKVLDAARFTSGELSPQELASSYLKDTLVADVRFRVERERQGKTPETNEDEADVLSTQLEDFVTDPKAALALLDRVASMECSPKCCSPRGA